MAVLDESLEKYKTYAHNIELEYRPLFGKGYPEKRMEFLEKILEEKYKFYWRKGDNL